MSPSTSVIDNVLFGADQLVSMFVALRIPAAQAGFERAVALGVIRRGTLVAGAVFHNYRGYDIEVSCAADDPRWATRRTLRRLFAYPFEQLGCARMTALTGSTNTRTQRFLSGIGFQREGCHPLGLDGVEDLISFGMTASACRWLKD